MPRTASASSLRWPETLPPLERGFGRRSINYPMSPDNAATEPAEPWRSFLRELDLHFVGLIIESVASQYPRHMFLHARGTSRRLLCPSEMQQIPFLPSWGEPIKGFGQIGVVIQTL